MAAGTLCAILSGLFEGELTRVVALAYFIPVVLIGSLLCLLAVLLQAALLRAGYLTPLVFFLPGALITLSQGLALPYAQAGAMATIPRLAGTAAGIGVFAQQVCGAGFAQLYGVIADGTPTPMSVAAVASAALNVVAGGAAFVLARSRSPD